MKIAQEQLEAAKKAMGIAVEELAAIVERGKGRAVRGGGVFVS